MTPELIFSVPLSLKCIRGINAMELLLPQQRTKHRGAFGEYKGYNSAKTPVSGRRILAITNTNDNSIPYTRIEVRVGFHSFSTFRLRHGRPRIYRFSVIRRRRRILQEGIRKFSYLNDQVVHIQGSAGHGLDNNLKAIIREFFNRPPPPNAPSSLQATRATDQFAMERQFDNESGLIQSPTQSQDHLTTPSSYGDSPDLAVDKDETWFTGFGLLIRTNPSQWSNLSSATVKRSRQLALSNYNVLFINIDDLKPMIGSFGDTTIWAPKMDLLSSSSLNFTNAHCQQAICTASGIVPDRASSRHHPGLGFETSFT